MWGLLLQVGIWAGLYVANWLLKPKDKSPAYNPQGNSLPKTDEGTAIPIVFGRTRVTSPTLVWTGKLKSRQYTLNGSFVVQYGLDMLFVVGIPMTGATSRFNILNPLTPCLYAVYQGDKKLPMKFGKLPANNGPSIVRSQAVHRKGFHGGPAQGGGLFGAFEWWWGSPDQNFRSPASRIGDLLLEWTEDATLIPGYRNQMCVSFHDDDPDGFYGIGKEGTDGADDTGSHPANWTVGESVNVDGYSFEVGTYGAMNASVTAMTRPGYDYLGDADPAEVIYETLTSGWSKIGKDVAELDLPSFLAASTTLKAEGHGYSCAHYDVSDGVSILSGVLKQIDAALYEEPTTGKLVLKLIRADYDPALLPVYTGSDIHDVEDYGIGSWKDCANEVRVNYNDRVAGYKPGTAIAQSLANATVNGNRRRVHVVEFPGISNATIASKVAARELNTLSRPLKKITLVLTRKAYDLRPGTCFKVNYPEYNLSNVIFRCGRVDVGQLFDNKVIVDAVEDVFASTYVGMGLSWSIQPLPFPYPFPTGNASSRAGQITADGIAVFEAPYWLSLAAKNIGIVNDQNTPHVMALARPTLNATGMSTTSREQLEGASKDKDSTMPFQVLTKTYYVDIPVVDIPTTFVVTADYSRNLEPYDTTTGLEIGSVEDPNRSVNDIETQIAIDAISDAAIQQDGQNMIAVMTPDGDIEFMAFELATTPDSGITYTLTNVWRGLMDTPAITIPAGSRGWFVRPELVGRRGFPKSRTIDYQLVPHAHYVSGSGDDDRESFTCQARCWLPVPPSDVRVNGEKLTGTTGLPAVALHYKTVSVLEECFDIYGRLRLRQSAILVKGSTADEAAIDASPTTYYPFAYKVFGGDQANPQGYGIASTDDGGLTDRTGALAGAVLLDGHGDLTVQIRSQRTMVAGDPAIGLGGLKLGDVLTSRDHPEIAMFAPVWRNLMGNPRFAYPTGTPWWTIAFVTVQTGTSSPSRLASGKYIQGNSPSVGTAAQTVPVVEWLPRGMTAIVWGYFRLIAPDVDDVIVLRVDALDGASASIANSSTAAISPPNTAWQYTERSLVMPVNTAKIKWSAQLAESAIDTSDACFTEGGISLGQIYNSTLNLLANPSFATAAMASWTVSAGTFTQPSTIQGPSTLYARGGNGATNTAFQEFTLPAGFECGAYACVRAWRAQVVAGDAGELKVEAMDAGSVVLASATTGSELLSTLNNWYERTISCNIPDGSTKVRVTFTALKTTGVDSGACLDDVRLGLHKKIDAAWTKEFDWNVVQTQDQPRTWQEYERAFVNVFDELGFGYLDRPRPALVFAGDESSTGFDATQGSAQQLIEWSDDVVHAPGKMVGAFADKYVSAFNFTRQSGGSAVCVEARDQAIDSLCAFRSDTSFTAIVFFRVDELPFSGVKCGLIGRRDLTAGWGIEISATGKAQVEFEGASGVKTITSVAGTMVDGAVHMIAIEYDAVGQEIKLYDESGPLSTISTAAGLGEFGRTAEQCRFRIGRSSNSVDTLPGMISRVYVFDELLGEDGIAGHWTYAKDVTDTNGLTYTRNVPAWCQIGRDSDGNQYVAAFSTNQHAMAYEAGTFGGGIAVAKQNTNRIPSWDFGGASWVYDFGTTIVQDVEDNTGKLAGINATVTAAAGFKVIGITSAASATFQLVFWAKALVSTGISIEFLNDLDVLKNTQAVTIGTTWSRHVVSFVGWDASTATLRLRFRSTAGTVSFTLGHVIWGQETQELPILYPGPLATLNDVTLSWGTTEIPRQFNSEGEIIVLGKTLTTAPPIVGSIVNVKNNTNNQNRRELYASILGQPVFHHYDGAAADVTSTGTAFDWSQGAAVINAWRVRCRWCRARMLDVTANAFAGVFTDANVSSSNYGRVATFSESSTKSQTVEMNKGTNAGINAIIRSITLRAREEKLP